MNSALHTCESLLITSEHDAANIWITSKLLKCLIQLHHEGVEEGVQHLGSIQLDEANILLLTNSVNFDILILSCKFVEQVNILCCKCGCVMRKQKGSINVSISLVILGCRITTNNAVVNSTLIHRGLPCNQSLSFSSLDPSWNFPVI